MVVIQRSKIVQKSNYAGLCPGRRWGVYSAPPDPLAGGLHAAPSEDQ